MDLFGLVKEGERKVERENGKWGGEVRTFSVSAHLEAGPVVVMDSVAIFGCCEGC